EWSEAFAAYEASGNLARFAALLERDGFPTQAARALERGWDFLVVNNVQDAARQMQHALTAMKEPLLGASELFRERLRKSLRWVEAASLHEKQRLLALQSLQRGDILRATIFGLESFISREVAASGGDVFDHATRKGMDESFQQALRQGEHPDWKRQAYWLLKNVRNACAHGTVPDHPPHAQLMKNPQRLARELEATLNRLTNA
ncbi:MAG: TIGR02221 family CRISPR-associated protein, partial [Myxococcota bacterium]|nr:TIGR02221 family CRISPR-associated protein [Myxococcota bacterium]